MQINGALNLVLPIRINDDGATVLNAYHSPISREVFESSYRIIEATRSALWPKGKVSNTAPRIARLALLDASKQDALDHESETDLGPAFLDELKRLTTILAPGPAGFDYLDVDAALARKVIDDEEWSEALSSLVFFTVSWVLIPKARRVLMMDTLALALGGSTTSLNPMEWTASTATLTKAASSEEQAASLEISSDT